MALAALCKGEKKYIFKTERTFAVGTIRHTFRLAVRQTSSISHRAVCVKYDCMQNVFQAMCLTWRILMKSVTESCA